MSTLSNGNMGHAAAHAVLRRFGEGSDSDMLPSTRTDAHKARKVGLLREKKKPLMGEMRRAGSVTAWFKDEGQLQ